DGSDAAQTVLEAVGKLRRHRDGVKIGRAEDRVRRANRLFDKSQAEMWRARLLRHGDNAPIFRARRLEIRAANVPADDAAHRAASSGDVDSFPLCISIRFSKFSRIRTDVSGPTPPGTGVTPTSSSARAEMSTSPVNWPSIKPIPASTITCPSLKYFFPK